MSEQLNEIRAFVTNRSDKDLFEKNSRIYFSKELMNRLGVTINRLASYAGLALNAKINWQTSDRVFQSQLDDLLSQVKTLKDYWENNYPSENPNWYISLPSRLTHYSDINTVETLLLRMLRIYQSDNPFFVYLGEFYSGEVNGI